MISNMIIERWLVFKISKYSHETLWLVFMVIKHSDWFLKCMSKPIYDKNPETRAKYEKIEKNRETNMVL